MPDTITGKRYHHRLPTALPLPPVASHAYGHLGASYAAWYTAAHNHFVRSHFTPCRPMMVQTNPPKPRQRQQVDTTPAPAYRFAAAGDVVAVGNAHVCLVTSCSPSRNAPPAAQPPHTPKGRLCDTRLPPVLQDPLYYKGNVRVRTAYQMKLGMEALAKVYNKLDTPTVAFHGTSDFVTDMVGVQTMLAKSSIEDKETFLIAGGYHVLLEGPEKEQVLSKLRSWLVEHKLAR